MSNAGFLLLVVAILVLWQWQFGVGCTIRVLRRWRER